MSNEAVRVAVLNGYRYGGGERSWRAARPEKGRGTCADACFLCCRHRHEQVEFMPDGLYDFLLECWASVGAAGFFCTRACAAPHAPYFSLHPSLATQEPEDRPTFPEILDELNYFRAQYMKEAQKVKLVGFLS